MLLRSVQLGALSLLGGCGLLFDVAPPDAADDAGEQVADGGRLDGAVEDAGGADGAAPDGAAPDGGVDAGAECEVPRRETLPLADQPLGAPVPDFYDTGCTQVMARVEGEPGYRAEAALASNGDGTPVIWLAAPVGEVVGLALDFGAEVEDVVFVFEWLSLDEGRGIEEHLTLGVDGEPVVPTLERPAGVYLQGERVSATRPNGQGQIRVERARYVKIAVENVGPGDGLGIELRGFEFTVPDAAP